MDQALSGVFTLREGSMDDGDILALCTVLGPLHPQTDLEGQFILQIGFDRTGVARGGAVLQTLNGLHDYVRDVVLPRFEPFLT